MNKKYEKYLPLGSVVLMKNAKKRVMITGYMLKSPDSGDKIWDYVGCLYPEGMVTSSQHLLFNHDDIGRIYAIGYSDEEQKKFINLLSKATVLNKERLEKNNE